MLVGYARASTMDKNPTRQIDQLKAAGCQEIFIEKASGSHRSRPELMAALDCMQTGDMLVVWKLSRLARSMTQLLKTINEINGRGFALRVVTPDINTRTPEGRLFFYMATAFGEFERELIAENTCAALATAKKQGRKGGRPKGLNEQSIKQAEALLKDKENYPFISDVINQLQIGRTAFYSYFSPGRIKELRGEHSA